MNKLIIVVAIILCFVSGCTIDHHNVCDGHFRISHAWSDLEQQIIRESVARWNAFAGHEVIVIDGIAFESNCGCIIRKQLDWEEIPEDEPPSRIGTYQSADGVIRIKYHQGFSLDINKFSTTVTHEMGHSLGLDHISYKGDLMSQKFDPEVLDFTERDRAMCEMSGICIPRKDVAK